MFVPAAMDADQVLGDYSLTSFHIHSDPKNLRKVTNNPIIWVYWVCRAGKSAPLLLINSTTYTELELWCIFLTIVLGMVGISMTTFVLCSTVVTEDEEMEQYDEEDKDD